MNAVASIWFESILLKSKGTPSIIFCWSRVKVEQFTVTPPANATMLAQDAFFASWLTLGTGLDCQRDKCDSPRRRALMFRSRRLWLCILVLRRGTAVYRGISPRSDVRTVTVVSTLDNRRSRNRGS